jgi:hypothetical protein
MNRSFLVAYQLLIGVSDFGTGVLLYLAPEFTLYLIHAHAPAAASPFIAFIGAFVLSVGLACLFGAKLTMQRAAHERIEVVWVLTAISRGAVAIYLAKAILSGQMESAWWMVASFDAACAAFQAFGLRARWLANAR